MSPSIHFEARLIILGIGAGAGLMVLYDILRIFRVIVRHSWLWIGLEDLGYWIFAGFAVFYLLYRENDGVIRLYVIGAVLIAMAAYDHLCSVFFRKVLKKIGRCFRIGVFRRK